MATRSLRKFLIGVCLRLSAAWMVGGLCLSAGCAALDWHRDGSDSAALELDLQDCRQLARADTAHLAWPFPNNTARLVVTNRARRAVATPSPYSTWLDADRSVLESELVGTCMRNKGYTLGPEKQPARP